MGGGVYGDVMELLGVMQVHFQIEHGDEEAADGGGVVAVVALGDFLCKVMG